MHRASLHGNDKIDRVELDGVMSQLAANRASVPTGDERVQPVSYTHLRAHETVLDLVCRLLLEKKKKEKISVVAETKNKRQQQSKHGGISRQNKNNES